MCGLWPTRWSTESFSPSWGSGAPILLRSPVRARGTLTACVTDSLAEEVRKLAQQQFNTIFVDL
jgi:hypothetical protein